MAQQRLPDLSSRQLRAVVALAQYRSFIAAAVDMRTSQPALTRTIKQVEQTLGVLLFSRSTRQVSITPAGREFVALAERLLNDLRIGVQNMREIADQQRGQVIVASIMSLGHVVLPEALADYNRRFPGVEIQLREGVQGQVQEDVRSGLADFGLGYVEDLPDALRGEGLAKEAFHAVLPRQHPLARKREVALAALKGERFVSLPTDSRTRRIIDGAAAAAGFAFDHIIAVNQFSTLYSLVRQGAGISVVPAGAGRPVQDPDLVFRPLTEPRIVREIGVITLPDRLPTPSATGALATIRALLQRPGAGRRSMRKSHQ